MGVDHIGYAVKSISQSKEQFAALGYFFDDEKPDILRRVNVSVGKNGGVRVELLSPLNTADKSPIDGYLDKIGSTPYHICYEVSDIDKAISELQEIGFTVLGSPAESVPLEGTVCFLYSTDIGLIEIIDYLIDK
ncbi:MAG: VOC family protein [Lachnospiraceae bacterium]|nr:VOC family protein [Lachnospiraceae bacterium]